MQRLPGLECSMFATRQDNNTLDSWDKTALQCLTYVVYSPPMVGAIPMLVVAAGPRDDHL